jgi:hypothetical protein
LPARELVESYYFRSNERLPQYRTEEVLRRRLSDFADVGLGEDGADQRRDHRPQLGACDGEQVAHRMDPAQLPTRTLQDLADRGLQPGVGITDDEPDAVEAALA